MSVEYTIISIGALSRNRLWGESAAVRTAHATTTLVCDGERRILIDPSLPAPALAARFNERTGLALGDVTDVFCTTLRPVHRRSIEVLGHAHWWVNEPELDSYREVARFSSYPQIGNFVIPTDHAEETFQVFDHPTVIVFRNLDTLAPSHIERQWRDRVVKNHAFSH